MAFFGESLQIKLRAGFRVGLVEIKGRRFLYIRLRLTQAYPPKTRLVFTCLLQQALQLVEIFAKAEKALDKNTRNVADE
jgi:hypothetical protein